MVFVRILTRPTCRRILLVITSGFTCPFIVFSGMSRENGSGQAAHDLLQIMLQFRHEHEVSQARLCSSEFSVVALFCFIVSVLSCRSSPYVTIKVAAILLSSCAVEAG